MKVFDLIKVDPSGARRGSLHTAHGAVECPAFMPVATRAAFRVALPRDVAVTGTQAILVNTYHMFLGKRYENVRRAGGLHAFMSWESAIVTDSGGFQVFSLPDARLTGEGVYFDASRDGDTKLFIGPEISMEVQRELGADVVMAFDQCTEYSSSREEVQEAAGRTALWAEICRKCELGREQMLFGIIQGGVFLDVRKKSAQSITALDFDGYAIGGVSVGEGLEWLKKVVQFTSPLMPQDKPRYLMGVGLPQDILESVERGMDMFDCVIPTRYARNGTLFTRRGKIRIMDKKFRKDRYPVDTNCNCYTCQHFTRMYLRHLFFAKEPIGEVLASIHNLQFYQDLMSDIREAIEVDSFREFKIEWLAVYNRQ